MDAFCYELSVWRKLKVRQWQASGEVGTSSAELGTSGCEPAGKCNTAAAQSLTSRSLQRRLLGTSLTSTAVSLGMSKPQNTGNVSLTAVLAHPSSTNRTTAQQSAQMRCGTVSA